MTETIPTNLAKFGGPRLIIGWRSRHGLDGRRVAIHEDTQPTLIDIAATSLARVNDEATRVRNYEPFGALDADEIFRVDPTDSSLGSAALIDLVANSHDLEPLSARDLADHQFAFYGIVFGKPSEDQLALIRKRNARAALAKGRRYFVYQDTLRAAVQPDLVLDDEVDMIIYGTSVYMLHEYGGRTLLNDTNLAQVTVSDNIGRLADVLGGKHAMTGTAEAAIMAVASRKVSVARRLANIGAFFGDAKINRKQLRDAAVARFEEPDHVVDAKGVVCADEQHVESALDLIEGRLYQDDVTGEERRADRVSRRTRR